MDIGTLSFLIFILFLGTLVYLKREKVEITALGVMFKTKKFKKIIVKLAAKYPKFWNTYFNIGTFISFLLMISGIYLLFKITINLLEGFRGPTLALVFPGPTSSFSFYPGVILMPIWYWIIGVAILVIPHEFSHGIALALNKLRIKSFGALLLFFIIPGAFVEPDEKQLKKARKRRQLQVYAAGSFSNILVGLAFVALFQLFLFSCFSYEGITYTYPAKIVNRTDILENNTLPNGLIELKTKDNTYLIQKSFFDLQKNSTQLIVFEDWPAFRNNLSGAIKRVNGFEIHSMRDLRHIISKHKPGDKINIETSNANYTITLANNNGKAFLGITSSPSYQYLLDLIGNEFLVELLFPQSYRQYSLEKLPSNLGVFIYQLLFFIYNICFSVAIINMLPIRPLDGGLILETLTNKRIANITSIIFFFLLLYIFVGPYI
jgi:membrane-associated protease RseP (regulator of RpoE activity)